MADEVKVAFGLRGRPDDELRQWRDDPPAFLGDYELLDESYDTLVYEAQVMGIGMKILMFGFAKTLYRLMVTFSAREPNGSRVTISGQAKEDVRDRMGAYIREGTEPL